jgi:hypothetical protein
MIYYPVIKVPQFNIPLSLLAGGEGWGEGGNFSSFAGGPQAPEELS